MRRVLQFDIGEALGLLGWRKTRICRPRRLFSLGLEEPGEKWTSKRVRVGRGAKDWKRGSFYSGDEGQRDAKLRKRTALVWNVARLSSRAPDDGSGSEGAGITRHGGKRYWTGWRDSGTPTSATAGNWPALQRAAPDRPTTAHLITSRQCGSAEKLNECRRASRFDYSNRAAATISPSRRPAVPLAEGVRVSGKFIARYRATWYGRRALAATGMGSAVRYGVVARSSRPPPMRYRADTARRPACPWSVPEIERNRNGRSPSRWRV